MIALAAYTFMILRQIGIKWFMSHVYCISTYPLAQKIICDVVHLQFPNDYFECKWKKNSCYEQHCDISINW